MCKWWQSGTAYTATQHSLSYLTYKTVSKTNVQNSDSQTLCKRLDIPQMDSIFSDETINIPSLVLIMGSLTLQLVPKAIRLEITNLNRTLVILISKSHSFFRPYQRRHFATLPAFIFFTIPHRRNLGAARGANAPPVFFLPKNIFYLAIALKRGK
jgi:hypothetical protein